MVPPERREQFERDFPESALPALPKPRRPRQPPADGGENPVVSAVGDLLHVHPRVSYAIRMNSGGSMLDSGRVIRFHIWVRSPEKCRMPDFFGALVDGRTLALECKRPTWKKPTDDREREQAAFLALVRSLGGIGEFITDAAQVEALLAR
jgi:hypothetical protein